jgi:hypothetical protein
MKIAIEHTISRFEIKITTVRTLLYVVFINLFFLTRKSQMFSTTMTEHFHVHAFYFEVIFLLIVINYLSFLVISFTIYLVYYLLRILNQDV